MTKEVGFKIGQLFPQIRDVIILDLGSIRGRPIKILTSVNLDKSLLRGANIRLNEVTCWVDFKYEQLANFCYYCRQIGHSERLFNTKEEDVRNDALKIGQFGEWLRGMSGRYRSKGDEGKVFDKLRDQGRKVVNGEMKAREEQPRRNNK